jgi:hypothetical protein
MRRLGCKGVVRSRDLIVSMSRGMREADAEGL